MAVIDLTIERVRRTLKDPKLIGRWKRSALTILLANFDTYAKDLRSGKTDTLQDLYATCVVAFEYYEDRPGKNDWNVIRSRIYRAHAELEAMCLSIDRKKAQIFRESQTKVGEVLRKIDALRR